MPNTRIYVETTIPSAYYTSRSAPEMVLRRQRTREWWRVGTHNCELLSSTAVIAELLRGRSEHVPARVAMIAGTTLLAVSPEARATAKIYVRRKLMPADPFADALHLALASHHVCDVLVTWNYRHLANPTKFMHIQRVNEELGLFVPTIATPDQLLGRQP